MSPAFGHAIRLGAVFASIPVFAAVIAQMFGLEEQWPLTQVALTSVLFLFLIPVIKLKTKWLG